MTAFAFGLQQVFEPERKEPAIMLETSGTPPSDLPVDAELDGLTAKQSVVRIRPWLLERTGGAETAAESAETGAKNAETATRGTEPAAEATERETSATDSHTTGNDTADQHPTGKSAR